MSPADGRLELAKGQNLEGVEPGSIASVMAAVPLTADTFTRDEPSLEM